MGLRLVLTTSILLGLVYLCSGAPNLQFDPLAVVGNELQPQQLESRTSLSPFGLLHRIVVRIISGFTRLLRRILYQFQRWVLNTSNYLELLQARQKFGPAASRVLGKIVIWLRRFVSQESGCIGRVLCELSDQVGF